MKLTKDELLARFGNNLSNIRKSKNLTLRELANRCNVNFSNIGQMESGKKNVTLITLIDLASGLDVPPKKLLDFDLKV